MTEGGRANARARAVHARRRLGAVCTVLLLNIVGPVSTGLTSEALAAPVRAQAVPTPTTATFGSADTPYAFGAHAEGPGPTVLTSWTGNKFLRLATTAVPPAQDNSISFARTAAGVSCRVRADFDFRITPASPTDKADGMSFALLNTGPFDVAGVVAPQGPTLVGERPDFARSLGVGFDIYKNTESGDINDNHLAVHYDATRVGQFSAGAVNLASGKWIHARVDVFAFAARLTVTLTPQGGQATTVVNNAAVPGLVPSETRVRFAARSGGQSANQDLDNVRVQYGPCPASVVGTWSGVISLPSVPIDAVLLPTGKVMYWDRNDYGPAGNGRPHVFDPTSVTSADLAVPDYDVFCTGHTTLPDGRVFLAGGHIVDHEGLAKASIYDPVTDTWTSLPDMNAGRWYPSATSLGNGDVLVSDGQHWDGTLTDVGAHNIVHNTIPQVFENASQSWRDLNGANAELGLYPYNYQAPDGRVLNAGPYKQAKYLTTTGSGEIVDVAAPNPFGDRDYGSSVMYGDGQVMIVGGSSNGLFDTTPPTNSADVIDLHAAAPEWRPTQPMSYPRRQINETLLADGTALVTGGTRALGFSDASGAVLLPEQWNPVTERWVTLAGASVPRLYHSVALLLPDGRVFTGGGGHPTSANDTDHTDAEIFSPPYLFRGPRPVITSAPTAITYGQTFGVGLSSAAPAGKMTWIRLGSVTHGFDESQRADALHFAATAGGATVTAPADPNVSPPGYYMLFVVSPAGVPSVAKIIRIGS